MTPTVLQVCSCHVIPQWQLQGIAKVVGPFFIALAALRGRICRASCHLRLGYISATSAGGNMQHMM
jgi:hypothetical protein